VQQKFLTGALILAGAGIFCRLLGVAIRIPLTHIVGNFGMGIYQMVFPLYALLLITSSAGFPVAISRMIAAGENPKRILLNSVILLGLVGALVTALFMILSYQIAGAQGNGDVGVIYLAIAPSVFLVCIISAFRGYFQGLQNMVPTAISQVIEQVVKLGVGLGLAFWFAQYSVIWAVFGAILGVTISEVVALCYLFLHFLLSKPQEQNFSQIPKTAGSSIQNKEEPRTTKSSKSLAPAISSTRVPKTEGERFVSLGLMWKITKASAPVTLMAAIFPLILVLDSMFVINMLVRSGIEHREATKLFGISSGAVHTLINLPAMLGVAVATAIVPTVSALLKQKKTKELRDKMSDAVNYTLLISVFFAIFYFAFAKKIIDLLYHSAFAEYPHHLELARNLLMIESLVIIFLPISAIFTAMLQGAGKPTKPLIALLVGGAIKIVVQFSLIGTPVGIYAVSIGNVLCFAAAFVLNIIFGLQEIKIRENVLKTLPKLIFITGVFTLGTFALASVLPDNRWWVVLAGALCTILWVILIAFFKLVRLNKLHPKEVVKHETI